MIAAHLLAVRIANPKAMAARDCLEVYENEFNYLCRSLRRLGTHPADVEDLVHEVFLVLHRRWNDYDPSRPLRPWLFGIVFRIASVHRRRLAREVPFASLEIEDRAPQPEQMVREKEARAAVLEALAKVPLPRRAVLVLHELDEVPMRDVASTLAIPLFTAYSRLRKARAEFKAAVQAVHKRARK